MSDRHTKKVEAIKERRRDYAKLERRAVFLLKVMLVVIAIFVVADFVMSFLEAF